MKLSDDYHSKARHVSLRGCEVASNTQIHNDELGVAFKDALQYIYIVMFTPVGGKKMCVSTSIFELW